MDLQALAAQFKRDHCVLIPGLLQGALLNRIRDEVEDAEFFLREGEIKGEYRAELCMRPGRALGLLAFFANDPDLFELVRAITGCDRIGSFAGRVYRMDPGPAHRGAWHDDRTDNRMVAMSLNLGAARYDGGVLEIRDRHSKAMLRRVTNTGAGDALLFPIADPFEHRVTSVQGTVSKTAFVGFFRSAPESQLLRPSDVL